MVVIDQNSDACRRISDDLDVQIITGSGSSPRVLLEAGIKDTDILLAVTDSDEMKPSPPQAGGVLTQATQ